MSDNELGEAILISRINYAEQVDLKDGECINVSPYQKVGPFKAALIPDVLPRGIFKQPVGDN